MDEPHEFEAYQAEKDSTKDVLQRSNRSLFDIEHKSPEVRLQYKTFYTLFTKENNVSQDVFKLTTQLLETNENNYTVWHARRKCLLKAFKAQRYESKSHSFYLQELQFIRSYCRKSPKCYQVWYHRRWVVLQLNDVRDELEQIALDLAQDQKNMNLWEYRTFLQRLQFSTHCCDEIASWNLPNAAECYCQCWFNQEMGFAKKMVSLDFRNNSAWNLRCVAVRQRASTLNEHVSLLASKQLLYHEIIDCLKSCEITPHNEPCWNVLRSFFYKETQIISRMSIEKDSRTPTPETPHLLYAWDEPLFVQLIQETLHHVLHLNPHNRFALFVQYLFYLTLKKIELCLEILRHLALVDSHREGYWKRKILLLENQTVGAS